MTVRRRHIPNATRAVPPIERVTRRFRSLNPPALRWRPSMPRWVTLDRMIEVTLPRVRWAERPMPEPK
ncbi:hypothetical protein [Methylopila sp. M107]|uniref:hypothetical protein n=1 Tax=Methylopila sp. M107 TaxID=1101190 RepID=UPI00035CA417|nr:hypothetical protein [Methylopila sp. M107]